MSRFAAYRTITIRQRKLVEAETMEKAEEIAHHIDDGWSEEWREIERDDEYPVLVRR